jgi:hypothetical protein
MRAKRKEKGMEVIVLIKLSWKPIDSTEIKAAILIPEVKEGRQTILLLTLDLLACHLPSLT